MNKKRIVSLAIWLTLPFAANATDPVVAVGPAHASSNAVIATASAPYVTVTPSTADESHIATTAYVKGAYNDAIAAVNNVAGDVTTLTNNMDDKQDKLEDGSGNSIDHVIGAPEMDDVVRQSINGGESLVAVQAAGEDPFFETGVVSGAGVLSAISGYMAGAGVEIYTTWDDDDATTGLLLQNVYDILPE